MGRSRLIAISLASESERQVRIDEEKVQSGRGTEEASVHIERSSDVIKMARSGIRGGSPEFYVQCSRERDASRWI